MYERYAKIRDILGLKDSDVCKKTGISPGTMSDWKRGRYDLKLDKLKKIADALEVSVNVFTEEEPEVHYIDEESALIAQKIFETPELRLLFRAASNSDPKDVQFAIDLLTRMKSTNNDG